VVISSGIGDGTPPEWVDQDWKKPGTDSSLKRIMHYISYVQPPKFPFPVAAALAARGKQIYMQQCAACHASRGVRTVDDPMLQTDSASDRHVDPEFRHRVQQLRGGAFLEAEPLRKAERLC
jgi:mono/diheme cytochrome c family protein